MCFLIWCFSFVHSLSFSLAISFLPFVNSFSVSLSLVFCFCFFLKSDPEGHQPGKTAVSREFSAYLIDCLVFLCLACKQIISLCLINDKMSKLTEIGHGQCKKWGHGVITFPSFSENFRRLKKFSVF